LIKSLYEKLLRKTLAAEQPETNDTDMLNEDSQILQDETIKYKDVAIGLPHQPSKRQKANDEAILLMKILKNENRKPTDAEKEILAGYTGNGGLGGIGLEDEYYTPDWVAKGAWEMFDDLPKGAKILDPSSGMGTFGRNMPDGVKVTQIELDSTSAELNKMTTELPLLHGTFQEQSYKIEDNSLDGVITNVPFAKVEDIGDDRFKNIKRLEQYFIIRSLELLKPSKRAIFLVPTGIMDNTNNKDYKDKILDMASFVGGIRLPNKVFSHTGADVAVDILVFEKHREDVYKAIKDNYVTYPSRQEVILGDKQNNAFYFGKYFSTIGKKYLLGEFISSKEFNESHFLGQTAFPKSTVVTKMTIDEIKEKVSKLSKSKFKNTVEYDDIELLGNVSITDKLAVETLRENDDFRAYFKEFNNSLYERKNITLKELKLFAEKYNKFALKSNNAQLPSIFMGRELYLPVMAINFSKWKITKQTLKMLNAMLFARYSNETRVEKENKEYIKFNDELSYLIEKSYLKKFKESNEYPDQGRINENIKILLSRFTAKLISNWDFKKNEPIGKFEFKKFKTIEDIMQGKGVNLAKEFNNGGYDAKTLSPEEILEVDDVFLGEKGKIVPASWIIYSGSKYKDAINHIDSLKYLKEYGLTEDEFNAKIDAMRDMADANKSGISIDSLTLSHKSVASLVDEKDMPLVRGIARDIANSMNLAYIKSDNVVKMKNVTITGMEFDDKGNEIPTSSIEEIETIDFPTTISISTFYAKNWSDNFRVLWSRHEEAIKKALDIETFQEAYRHYGYIREKYKGERGRDLQDPLDFYGKLKPIIMKDILHYRDSFDIQLDTKLKLNPVISEKIKQTLDDNAIIKIEDSQKHAPIESLRRYVNDSIVDTNHGYQNEDIRHFSTALKGVIAQDTGLGKSRTIFMSALLAITTNRVKRALVVVPTSVYDKWVMEIRDGRKDENDNIISDPMLNEAGRSIVAYTKASTAQSDWTKFVKSEELRIMVMPHSVFETFIFKQTTLKKLFGTSKEEERANKDNEDFVSIPNSLPDFNTRDWDYTLKKPTNTIGYFEDGKIDFVTIDEGQMAKNSSTGGKSVKFASSIQSSRYGVVLRTVQAIINRRTFGGSNQGVVIATATPFTSSPLEIYTMLKNTGGLENFNDFSDFEDTFMVVSEREETMATDPNQKRLVKVFEGLDNLSILRHNGLSNIIYRNAEEESKREVNSGLEEGALKPEKETFDVSLEESTDVLGARSDLIHRNSLFKEFKKDVVDSGLMAIPSSELDESSKEIIASYRKSIMEDHGLDILDSIQRAEVSRKASTFSLIHGLNMLAINKDMATRDMVTFNISNLDKKTLDKLIEKLLKATVNYKDIEQYYDKDGELCEREITVKVKMDEFLAIRNLKLIDGDILSIPSVDEGIVSTVFDITSNDSGLLDIEDYPKYKSVLENISKELKSNPKAKQLVFSVSVIGARILEHFIKQLYKDLKIVNKIMSALNIKETKAKKKGEKSEQSAGALAQFQEDYNNSNISTVLIFTTRNSTGVDFNKMTKAIHLVDIPYTPDVWHQAEGRGVRQGNKILKVNVYKYSATGTLDTMKKVLLSEKGSWQDEIKDSDSRNSISSIQVDGKKLIEEVMANNPNATEEDIREIIKEKQSEREAIVAEENKLKVEAVKQSISDSNNLIKLSHETDNKKIYNYLGDFNDFKGNRKSVDIFDSDTTGQSVLKNIKTNGYKAIQMFVSDMMKDSISLGEDKIREKLDEITLSKDYYIENRTYSGYSNYLDKIILSTQYDNNKEYYETSYSYQQPRVQALSEDEAESMKDSGYKVNKKPMLTKNQYQDANMLLEQYLERAKNDVETKLISIKKSESIFKDAVKNAIGVIGKEEEDLYKGLLSGKSVLTLDESIVNIEDTVNIYKQSYSKYIEIEPKKLIELSTYHTKAIELTDEYQLIGRESRSRTDIAETIEKYEANLEKLKGSIEANKDRIVKYFNTSPDAPTLSKETFKGINSLIEYIDVVKLTTNDLKDISTLLNIDYINSDRMFKGLQDETVTFNNETIAVIGGELFCTTKIVRVNENTHLSSTPIIGRYNVFGDSDRIDVENIEAYNYNFIMRLIDAELEDIKGMVKSDPYSFGDKGGVIYPRYALKRVYENYLEKKGKKIEREKAAEDVKSGDLSDKTFEDIKDIVNGSIHETIKTIFDSIINLEYEDTKLKNLGELLRIAKDGKIARYGKFNDNSKPIGVHISTDLQMVITNGVPNQSFGNSGRGRKWQDGIAYEKYSATLYELDGMSKEYTNKWYFDATDSILVTAKGL